MPATISFDNIQLPRRYSYGAVGGPRFNTTVLVAMGGVEQRNVNWLETRAKYDLTYAVQEVDDLQELLTFFRCRLGRARSFRFWDPMDYQLPLVRINLQFTQPLTFTSGTPDTVTRDDGVSWLTSGPNGGFRIGDLVAFSGTVSNNVQCYITGYVANALGVIDTIEVGGEALSNETDPTVIILSAASNFVVPVGDGSTTTYQVAKRYHNGPETGAGPNVFTREISKLVRDSEKQGSSDTRLTIGGSVAPALARNVADTEVIVDFDLGQVDLSLVELTNDEMTITAITKANPAVVTVDHDMEPTLALGDTTRGLVNGETVWIKNVTGMTEINNTRFAVRNIAYGASTTFELESIDGTALNSSGFTVYTGPSGEATKILQVGEPIRMGDSAEFDVHTRFDVDLMEVEAEYFNAANWNTITLVEII
jgi:hypothetical protein